MPTETTVLPTIVTTEASALLAAGAGGGAGEPVPSGAVEPPATGAGEGMTVTTVPGGAATTIEGATASVAPRELVTGTPLPNPSVCAAVVATGAVPLVMGGACDGPPEAPPPCWGRALTRPAAPATGTAGVGVAEDRDTGTLVGGDDGLVEGGVVEVVGCGHNALAVPPRAASMPQIVIGIVTPVPGVPGVPIEMPVVPAPVHTPDALPSSAAVTEQTVTGTLTGTEPVGVVAGCVGSHELLAVPATATTTLQALTGITPSMGALLLTVSVGRSFTSGNPVSDMHMPFAVPSTSAMTPQTVAGTKRSASWPDCDTVLGSCGQLAVLFPSTSAMTSRDAKGGCGAVQAHISRMGALFAAPPSVVSRRFFQI